MKMKLAPVCLFVYKRLFPLQRAIDALLNDPLSAQTDLHIFSDAAGVDSIDQILVQNVRSYIKTVRGFNTVELHFAEEKKGLAESIIEGVSMVLKSSDNVIVLEDDLIVSANFLEFINGGLNAYAGNAEIFAVCGYSRPIRHYAGDVYFTRRASSWGWGSWRDRWEKIDWQVKDYSSFMNDKSMQERFNEMGSDMTDMLHKQMNGEIDSWAIRWTFHQFLHGLFSVFPTCSKISNEGFEGLGAHTRSIDSKRFATSLDWSMQQHFSFPARPFLDPVIIKQFVHPYSLQVRAYYKLLKLLRRA